MPPVPEAERQVVGDRDRVIPVGVLLERAGDEDPGRRDPHHFAKHDPEGVRPNGVAHPREAEQEPRALSRGIRAEGDHPGGKLLPRHEIPLHVRRFAASPEADPEKD